MPKFTLKKPPEVDNSAGCRARALLELGIDRPFYSCRVVGGRLEFTTYGGDILFWPDDPPARSPRPKEVK